jgi:hypothetical protein
METAFKVLRSAGYAAHALSVAERAGQPEWILDVLLEDMQSYAEAVAFIGKHTHVVPWPVSPRQKLAGMGRAGGSRAGPGCGRSIASDAHAVAFTVDSVAA